MEKILETSLNNIKAPFFIKRIIIQKLKNLLRDFLMVYHEIFLGTKCKDFLELAEEYYSQIEKTNLKEIPYFHNLIYIPKEEYEKKEEKFLKIVSTNPKFQKILNKIESNEKLKYFFAFNINKENVKKEREKLFNEVENNKIRKIIIKLNELNPV